MARNLEQERLAIEEEERRLQERRKKLADREREEALQTLERSGLLKLEIKRLESLATRIKTLGITEVEKRLAA